MKRSQNHSIQILGGLYFIIVGSTVDAFILAHHQPVTATFRGKPRIRHPPPPREQTPCLFTGGIRT